MMPDREKVIKALELEDKYPDSWDCTVECPYYGKTNCVCWQQVTRDAIELLKAQEPVKPDRAGFPDASRSNGTWYYICGTCNTAIDYKDKFCRGCGRAVKWDD